MKKITKGLAALAVGCGIVGAMAFVPDTMAADVCSIPGISEEVKKASGCGGGEGTDIEQPILSIVGAVLGLVALVAVIFIIIGGINYMTSQGDPGKTKKAKDTILYAVIGLIICGISFAIVNWAVGAVTGQSSGNVDNSQQQGGPQPQTQ